MVKGQQILELMFVNTKLACLGQSSETSPIPYIHVYATAVNTSEELKKKKKLADNWWYITLCIYCIYAIECMLKE